jgi:hypothetical protein
VPYWIARDSDREWTVDENIDNVESAVGKVRKEYEGKDNVDPGLQLIPMERKSRSEGSTS